MNKKIGISFFVTFLITVTIQVIYILFLSGRGYVYIIDCLFSVINEIIIISGLLSCLFWFKKSKVKNRVIVVSFVILTIVNLIYMVNSQLDNKSIIKFSRDFSNVLVLKQNKGNGKVTYYNNIKTIFVKEKESFSTEVVGNIKTQWLTTDICAITYVDKYNDLKEFVATYGDRGNGVSYYYVSSALKGEWQSETQYEIPTRFTVDSNGFFISKNNKEEKFDYSDCKQFGTTALVLYNGKTPRYVIALNKNCKIDDVTDLIEKSGTITICEVAMDLTLPEELYCMTYKDNSNLNDYKLVDLDKNDYTIKNDILYISYDGKNIIEVPGDFKNSSNGYNDNNYQISKEKTVFFYNKDSKRYLVYSDDEGKNWNTVEIENDTSIQSLQFVNSNLGYMLEFEDAAMGTAWGRITKTTDGGKTWDTVNFGIGDGSEKIFKIGSQIKFITENLGFLTMPSMSGDSSEIYITKDGGKTFDLLVIKELEEKFTGEGYVKEKISLKNIYDYYNLPYLESGKIYLKISQGCDGDYNGGDYKLYVSEDNADTWRLENKSAK